MNHFVQTLHLFKHKFWWLSLNDIEDIGLLGQLPYLHLCQKAPGENTQLLQPAVEPKAPWKEISMDFIVELPKSSGNTVIWVITDLFSKQVHFVPCQKIPSNHTLMKMFVQHVYRLHGAPEE